MNIEDLKNLIKTSQFNNPTKGSLGFKEVVEELMRYRNEDPVLKYKIVIGTDSEDRGNGVDFVSVVAIQRIGKGGRYFWLRSCEKQSMEMRNRIYKEATMSLALAQVLLEQESIREVVKKLGKVVLGHDLEIHVDIGNNGPTKAMIKEIVGMIRGSGFYVKIKPEAFAAANVADKHL